MYPFSLVYNTVCQLHGCKFPQEVLFELSIIYRAILKNKLKVLQTLGKLWKKCLQCNVNIYNVMLSSLLARISIKVQYGGVHVNK